MRLLFWSTVALSGPLLCLPGSSFPLSSGLGKSKSDKPSAQQTLVNQQRTRDLTVVQSLKCSMINCVQIVNRSKPTGISVNGSDTLWYIHKVSKDLLKIYKKEKKNKMQSQRFLTICQEGRP